MKDERQRLLDIRETIERIEKYTSRGLDAFLGDELLQTSVDYQIQIIGKAARACLPSWETVIGGNQLGILSNE